MRIKMTRDIAQTRSTNTNEHECPESSPNSSPTAAPALSRPDVSWLDYWLTRMMLNAVGNPPVRIILWNGKEASPVCENPAAIVTFSDRAALLKIIMDHELYWGELYSSNRVRVEGDMTRLIEVVNNAVKSNVKPGYLRKAIQWLAYRQIISSKAQARKNIHHHYDIGNEFYALWLDRDEMQYSCAYFPHEDMTLEQAQVAKLHHICRKLQLKPGDTVVEAGCGWGGLSHFMVKHYGVKVTAYNISEQQINFARQRAQQDNLSNSLHYIMDDYRNINGQFDVFVSVGMLEHVAQQDYQELGNIIQRCLKPDGRGLVHSIGRIEAKPMNPWIERNIFPGAYPPALSEMLQIFEPNRLAILDVENLRLHYAKTIQHWAQRFEQNKAQITDMMDTEFVNAWSVYLYGSIAAFNIGNLQLFQIVFNHQQNNTIPRSRHYQYQHDFSTAVATGAETFLETGPVSVTHENTADAKF